MATSDNVLRAGLTPKHRDVDNLLASLTWTFGVRHSVKPTPLLSSMTPEYSWVYDPHVPEFSVVQVRLPPGEREAHAVFDGPSILIVTEGWGRLGAPGEEDMELKEGSVVFIGAGVGVHFSSGTTDSLVLYRAYYP